MMNWTALSAVMVAMSALVASSAGAQPSASRKLAHDPFDQRAALLLKDRAAPQPGVAAPMAEGMPRLAPGASIMAAELRAVMVGGARPLVNLGGTMLGIGDSTDGYRLVEIHERGAVFARDGKRFELALGRLREP